MSYLLTPERAAGGWYTDPHRYAFYGERLANLRGRWAPPRTLLVAGDGFGYLVDECRVAGYDAWGVDLSDFSRDGAPYTYPSDEAHPLYPHHNPALAGTTVQVPGAIARNPGTAADRFRRGDCRVGAAMASLRQAALGGPSSRRFSVLVTEDLLSAVEDDAEITQIVNALSPIGQNIAHVITMRTPDTIGYESPDGWWLTAEQWRARLPAGHVVIRSQDLLVL